MIDCLWLAYLDFELVQLCLVKDTVSLDVGLTFGFFLWRVPISPAVV